MAPSTTRKTTTTTRTIITTTTRTTSMTTSDNPLTVPSSSSNPHSLPSTPTRTKIPSTSSLFLPERPRSASNSSTNACDVIDLTRPSNPVRNEGRTADRAAEVVHVSIERSRVNEGSAESRTNERRRTAGRSNQRTGIGGGSVTDFFQAIMETEIRAPRARSRAHPIHERRGIRPLTTLPSVDIPPLDFNLAGDYGRWATSPNVQICSPPMAVPEYMKRLEAKGYTRNGSAVIIVDEDTLIQTSAASEPAKANPTSSASLSNVPSTSTSTSTSTSSSSSSSTSSATATTTTELSSRNPRTKIVPGRIKCPLCSQLPSNGWHATRCGHVFCQNCIVKVKSRKVCVACRKAVKPADVRRLFL